MSTVTKRSAKGHGKGIGKRKEMAEDKVYCNDQKDAQKLWRENNADYWKEYRDKNPEHTKRNREKQTERNRSPRAKACRKPDCQPIAKMDAIGPESFAVSVRYRLIPFGGQMIAKMDALIAEISAISSR